MNRTLTDVDRDLHTLAQQIQATLDGKLSPKDRHIILKGFEIQKQKLDRERQSLLGRDQGTVPNCKVGKTVPVPERHPFRDIHKPQTSAQCD